jgi:alpha-amylase
MHISHVIDRRFGQKLCYLRNFGWKWGFLNDSDAVAFIDNHDNQRGHGGGGSILNFFTGRRYKIANAFMLAWPYGCVQVMSSYNFHKKDHNQGPPSNKNGHTIDVRINKDGSCSNGWMCEHRWKQIANMVEFRNVSGYEPVKNWWDNGSNQIAFSRGTKSFIAINNDDFNMRKELQTSLPTGIYRDVISENRLVYVRSNGTALIDIQYYTDDPIIAIHVNSKLN